jgi:DNA-binding LacI/PurR family transcriptional regulator
MNKEKRQNRIIQLIEQSDKKKILGTRELAEDLGVSEMTVRRDLQELSEEGLLQRQHGGAGRVRPKVKTQQKEVGILLVSRTGKYSDPFFNAVLEAVDQRLHELGYRIAYINTHAEIADAEQADHLFETKAVSGLILVGPPLGTEPVDYIKSHISAVVNIAGSIGPDVDAITFDGYSGMRQMVDHLVNRGYRRLGFIAGHFDARQQGYLDGVIAHGLPNEPALCVAVPSGIDGWTPQLGYIGAKQLMQLPNPPDAILCASDLIATGAIQWLHQHKIRIPEDIAVTGFDNISESAFTVPSLTTVHVHKHLMGTLAAERVVKRIENEEDIPLFIQTPTHLVIRHSCGSE